MSATIEVHTAAHQANSVGDFWGGITRNGSGTTASPFEAPNAFPCNKNDLKEWKPYLDELNDHIAQARSGGPSGPATSGDISEQLANLAQLHDAGTLTDEEFASASQDPQRLDES